MPSPFPGMDPYLEGPDLWPDVHHGLIASVQDQLNSKLRPLRYVARVELRTFMFEPGDPASELYVIPDARIVERDTRAAHSAELAGGGGTAAAVLALAEPVDVTGLAPTMARDRYLEIRDPANRRVVTVIEILSPSNKIVGSAGRRAFEQKRGEVGDSDASWLEIDLLRRGTPTVNFPTVPRSAYRAYADRTTADGRRQLAWPIGLRQRLPLLPVPLRPGEADVPLDLQAVLDAAYDRAGYDLDVDYARPPAPPLDPDDAAWADALLRERGPRA